MTDDPALSALVAHDLRGPLGTLLVTTRTLSEEGLSVEDRRAAAGRVERAVQRLERLADLLRVDARGTGSGGRPPEPPWPLDVALERLVADARATQPGADVGTHLDRGCAVVAEEGLARLAFSSLLEDAVQGRGRVDVLCSRGDRDVRVEIRRSAPSVVTAVEALAGRLVQSLGGGLERRCDASGTVLTVRLPRAPD